VPERFRIKYEDPATPDIRRNLRHFHFWVSANDEPRRHVGVCVPISENGEDIQEIALAHLELELRTFGSSLFAPDDDSTEILLLRGEIEAAVAHRSPNKDCVWQERATREWACLAHTGEGSPITTPSVCGGCKIPDKRIICAHLMKPGISSPRALATRARLISTSPGCMIAESPEDGVDCRIGGKECWERTLETHISSPIDPPPNLPQSVADELDFLRLVARDRLGISDAVPVPEARSISGLFDPCDSAEDLQRRVATIGDLLNHLGFIGALSEPEQKDEQGRKRPPLAALEKLLEKQAPEAAGQGGPVASLRSIVRIRNTFPVHSQIAETRKSFRDLGIEYPPPDEDWQFAWTKILAAFWSSIRRVREALQHPL
jgi:hypothetical protein